MEKQADLFAIRKSEKRVVIVFLLILAIIWVVPLYSVITNSLKVDGINNYIYVITHPVDKVPFVFYFINSAICAIGSSLLLVIISSMAGFSFSKIKFKGRRIIYSAVLMCMATSGAILFIPFFYILKNLHMYNTYWAVIIPEVVGTLPFAVLMMKNYFDGLPTTIIESAHIDGASTWQVYLKIFLPLSKPAIINLAVLQIMWSFQDFWNPLMFLTSSKLFTATVAINSFKGVYGTVGLNLWRFDAALVIIAVPAIIVFIFAQKYIVRGITAGAIKD